MVGAAGANAPRGKPPSYAPTLVDEDDIQTFTLEGVCPHQP
jgi:hypothetical protein